MQQPRCSHWLPSTAKAWRAFYSNQVDFIMDIPLSGLSTTFIDELAEYYQGRSSTSGMKLRRLGNVLPERNERVPLAIGENAALPASETVQLYLPSLLHPLSPFMSCTLAKRDLSRAAGGLAGA